MARIHDVAAYILAHRGAMTTMKLQKLCYYAYGYHLAWEGRELFTEPFEAWANGPVSPALYGRHRGRFRLEQSDIPMIGGDTTVLDVDEQESVDIVLDHLGASSPHELSKMTHRESPWLRARERAGVAALDRTSERLQKADIYEFFDALTSADS